MGAAGARGVLPPELDERFAWEVLLGRDRSVNAFALPGGYFGVHLGLVGVIGSRDELASVLAHEMTHITQRHIARLLGQQSRQSPLLLAAMVLGALAASKNPQAGAALAVGGQAAVIQQQLNFSRDMEREADRIGYGVMTQAGFAPQGFVGMFERLQSASRINDNGDWPYLRSHPLTTQRIADMQARMPARAPGSAAAAAPATSLEHAMLSARSRVLSYSAVDELRSWSALIASPAFASLEVTRKAASLYGAALAAIRLRNFPEGAAMHSRLLELTKDNAAAARLTRLLAM